MTEAERDLLMMATYYEPDLPQALAKAMATTDVDQLRALALKYINATKVLVDGVDTVLRSRS